MSAPGINHIGIEVQAEPATDQTLGNVLPILHEVRHALARLARDGEQTSIDLRTLPLTDNDEQDLRDALGKGEISATLNALGTSTVQETAIHGVWWIEHRNADDELMVKLLDITPIPAILQTDARDIADGLDRLTQQLEAEETPATEG
jgi:hydrogenase-1 operon protein HyaF